MNHEKIAQLLEAVADAIDEGNLGAPVSAASASMSEEDTEHEKLAVAYTRLTGDTPSAEILDQLRNNDVFKSTMLKMSSTHINALGGPSEKAAATAPVKQLRGEAAIEQARQTHAQNIINLLNR